MRIAIVLNTSWNIYNFRKGLIKSLLDEGHQIIAIAPKDAYSSKIEEMGCIYYPINLDNKGSNPLKDLKYTYNLYKIYKESKPDIILHFTIKPNIYGTFAAYWLGIPIINNVCGLGTVFLQKNFSSWLAKYLYKISFRFPDRVFFQNEDDMELFLERKLIKKHKVDLLPGSGVSLEQFKPVSYKRNEVFRFLMISRLIFDKGIIEYIGAIRILRSKGINATFQLLGAQDDRDALGIKKAQLEEWVKEGLVEYLGTTDRVDEYIQMADCVVLPSYREGTPKALLESASMAKPLIATNVAGCRQTIEHEVNGFLCNVKDAEDLASKMETMFYLNDETLKNMGLNGRLKMEREFDEKLVIDKYKKLIQKLEADKEELAFV